MLVQPLVRRGRLVIAAAATMVAGLLAITPAPATAVGDPCGPGGNAIACENSLPGTPASVWDINGAGDDSIQGFSTDISVNVGSRIDFKIDTNASAYSVTIYRMGYYGGDGARQIATVNPSASLPQNQPQCISDAATELYDCGNWAVSASWDVPSTAVSGVYIALLKRADTGDASHITFVVRNDASHSDLVMQTSDTTWQAYNSYGGSNFYQGGANGRAYKISYNRPILTRSGTENRDFFFANEYPLVRFLEQNGYDVSYQAGVDTDRRGNLLTNHRTYLSVGHDEYWSGAQRANVEAARDAGVNLMFLSGNEMYWRTRYEPSADASHTAYRTMVSYKETWANAKLDPSAQWTGTWRDPRYAPPSQGGGRPENAVTGTAFASNHDDLAVTVTAAEASRRLWRNTGLSGMTGPSTQLALHTVGYESDEDLDNGHRPPGLIWLSTTTGNVPEYLQDFGNTVAPGTTTHHLTMYRAASGALVFSAGSIRWTWGLDSVHDAPTAPEPADRRMQQAQVNLLADMGAQPTTLAPDLVAATASTDTAGPTTTILTPAAGAAVNNGANVTVTGTASDAGAGVVAGVEASTDGGATWRPATGTTSWSFSYVQKGTGATPIRVRAIDDSANIGSAATRSFNVACPCSVFGVTAPAVADTNDGTSVELGLRFTPTTDGFVSGVRFYKGSGNTGSHVGSVWNSAGARLAQVNFTGESATGWQTATFATAVPVTAGQTYVVSYTAPNGHYASQAWAFAYSGLDATPLQVAGGFGAPSAGVFGSAGAFPNVSHANTNYFVDALFTTVDQSPLTASAQWPLPDSSSVPLTTTVGATYSKPLATGTAGLTLKDALGATVPGTVAYNSTTRVITFTPTNPLNGFVRYTATLSGTDTQGNGVTTGKTWSFTSAKPANAPGVCPCSLFTDSTVPGVLEAADPLPVTLGVRFSPDVNGTITGVRFYKGPNNTGTHTGSLWTATGTQLATGTFTGESSAGWQTLTFDAPVPVTKNTTYVAAYRASVGRYSATPNAFSSADLSRPPLRVTSSAGAFTYATGFPNQSSASSYLVDVLFEKGTPLIAVASQDPAPGAVDVPRNSTISVTLSEPIVTGYTLRAAQGTTNLPGTTTLSADAMTLTLTPAATLPANADVTVTLSGVVSAEGASLPTQTWTFHTRAPEGVGAQTLFGDQVPATPAASDGAAVELGTAFTPTKNGQITALRFFKGAGNGGTHVGSLWSSTGVRLGQVTFTAESATGWQTAALAAPVQVTAGTTYVVSYLAPQGHYAVTPQFFASAWTSGDLSAPAAANGRYLYGAAGGFPQFSFNATNYFVDVVFERAAPSITVTGRDPAAGATDVIRSVRPSITFSDPLAAGWSMSLRNGTTPIAGTAALSGDGRTLTFTPSAQLPADTDLTASVSGVASTEGAVLATQSWTFRTEAGTTTTASMFGTLVPNNPAVSDNAAVELGTAFVPDIAGSITAIRFYKGPGNTGTHTGSIWSSTGQRLATVTFTGETASGWQTAQLATPLAVQSGQTYVVSYLAPNGRYSATGAFFATPFTAGHLTVPSGTNGRYRYGAGGGFPTASWNSTNYFVDVVFRFTA